MSSTVEKRPCPVASAPTPKKHKTGVCEQSTHTDMIIEEGPAPKPVSSSPQVVQTSTKPVAKGQTFTEILSLNALQYLCKLKYSDFLKVFPQPEMDKIGTCSPVEF
jgi:hypothetical protein